MPQKIIFFIFIFYILTLFQSTFLVHFSVFGIVPNLVLILVILINLFTHSSLWGGAGVLSALIGGFFLDVFSSGYFGFFGFYTLFLLLLSLFLNFILKKYVEIPFLKIRRY